MNDTAAGDAEGRTVLAYDGDCGFCQAAVRQIQLRANPRTAAVAWQTLPPELTEPHLERLDREVLLFHEGRVRAAWGRRPGRSPRIFPGPHLPGRRAVFATAPDPLGGEPDIPLGGQEPAADAGRYSSLRGAPPPQLKAQAPPVLDHPSACSAAPASHRSATTSTAAGGGHHAILPGGGLWATASPGQAGPPERLSVPPPLVTLQ